MKNNYHIETLLTHQNFGGDDANSVARPIYPSTAFRFNDADHGANLFDLAIGGNIYTRLTNTTNDDLGNLVSELEGGVGGLAVASGAAALTTVLLCLCKSGDHIVASRQLYGGSIALLQNTISQLGITTTFVDQDLGYDELTRAFKPETKLVIGEIIGNPTVGVLDAEKFKKLAKAQNVPLLIDSTFTPPTLFKAADHGADIIIHSATKYLGGHGNALGGVIVDTGNYDWGKGKFPELNQPDPAYHGLNYVDTFGPAAFILKCRTQILRDTGMTISPFNSYAILTGIQTLHVRTDYISRNALALAQWLEQHPNIEWVGYPLLESSPYYERAKGYFPKGAGGILAFRIKGDLEVSKKFINSIKLGIHAVNVGDVRTIVTHPASTTHRQSSKEELETAGISENLIRISVGLENLDDLKDDLNSALGGK